MESNYTFIHIEASSTKSPAFPVEIYWGTLPYTTGRGYLINPEGIVRWRNWDAEFYSIHHITHDDLQIYGSHPSVICEAINQQLSEKTIYSKQPENTKYMVKELFCAGEIQPCEMVVLEIDNLFLELIEEKHSQSADEILKNIKNQIAEQYPHYLCGGASEGMYYLEIWKNIDSIKSA